MALACQGAQLRVQYEGVEEQRERAAEELPLVFLASAVVALAAGNEAVLHLRLVAGA